MDTSTASVMASRVPTGGALRASMATAAAMHATFVRVVVSTAVGVSRVPTGSPSTNAVSVVYGGIAFSINITGDIYLDIWDRKWFLRAFLTLRTLAITAQTVRAGLIRWVVFISI